jgi:hypothetical protein
MFRKGAWGRALIADRACAEGQTRHKCLKTVEGTQLQEVRVSHDST